jgi:anti-sigma B factor antagonist
MGMLFEHYTERGIDIVKLPILIMLSNAREAREFLGQIIRGGSGRIVIDCSLHKLTDSTITGLMIWALKQARQRGGDIYLVGLNGLMLALFELTRLHTVFRIFEDVASAVTAFTPDEGTPSTP